MAKKAPSHTIKEELKAPQGRIDVEEERFTKSEALFPGDGKDDGVAELEKVGERLDYMQEMLYANGLESPETAPAVLLLLQGMDTAGKGGVIRHVIGQVDPQGVRIKSFKAPTKEEREHDFLWRIEKELPKPGQIGIFDRSQYEDVLIQRVESMASPEEIERRYGAINDFEKSLADRGIVLIKCFLNVSKEKQKERLAERLIDPEKYWKYNPGDLDARAKWDDYMEAYSIALDRCNTDHSPWYIIPADRKWYRNWAVAELLAEVLEELDLEWPKADFDVELEKKRVEES